MLSRKPLTDLLISTLASGLGKPVGDSTTPTETYGWTGQPDAPGSTFIPYIIVTPGSTTNIKGPLSDTHADINLPYQVSGFGVTRAQCEWIMDASRDILDTLKRTDVVAGSETYRLSDISLSTLGGVARGNVGEYEVFGQTDIMNIFASKQL